MQYNRTIDHNIYDLLKKYNKLHFNGMLKNIFPNNDHSKGKYLRKDQETLRQHLEKMIEQEILERNIMIDENNNPIIGKPRYYWFSEKTKFQMHYGLFEGVKSKREGTDKKGETKNRTRFEDLSKTEQREIAYQLLLSNISQDSSLDIPATTNSITGEISSFSFESLEGFRISELINRNRKISSIEKIRESFSKLGPDMENYIFTQYYSQLVHPKNWFLDLQLSQQEIEKCIELLEDEKYSIIRKSGLFNGEILYKIDNGDKEMNGVINDDKNEKEKEINNSTFILACYQIFSFLFFRMCLVWMFGKFPYNTEEVNWFRYIYGNKITTNFFINIKEQRREYENRIKENLKGYLNKTSLTPIEKEKIIERKIKKTAENNIKYYDISIKKNLEDVSKLYGYKVKQPKKIFYNIMLKIIYPSFLRKEYNLYLDV